MQIAPGVITTDWKALKLDDANSPDWDTAIQILERRIAERYFAPVDFLIQAEVNLLACQRRYGFAVLAIDCLLVETLEAFREGLEDTDGKSKATFSKFLTSREQFKHFFPAKADGDKFYKKFRCGILHQAETAHATKVWSVGPLIRKTPAGVVVVNRNEFHRQLKLEFDAYLAELRDPKNDQLRRNFRKKMDFISRA
jgi:hypothetical protein